MKLTPSKKRSGASISRNLSSTVIERRAGLPRPAIECLEARIAPAVIFLSGDSASVTDKDGVSVNVSGTADDFASTVAFLVKKGDSVILDTNGNHAVDPGEVEYAKVTGGAAFFFAKDINTNNSFGADEITGIAYGDGFKAVIHGDVNGSVISLLNKEYAASIGDIQDASLAGLTVSGRIKGHLAAGRNIANVVIGAEAAGTDFAVTSIRTGTATNDVNYPFNGLIQFGPTFGFGKTIAGGNISNVTLTKGAGAIIAGEGASSAIINGGAGGSVSKITFIDAVNKFHIAGGPGGNSSLPKGKGGVGGSVSQLTLEFTSDAASLDKPLGKILGGGGGRGNTGGKAGDVSKSTLTFKADALHEFVISGGIGGDATDGNFSGRGGLGGSVIGVTVTATGKVDRMTFAGGDGGFASLGVGGNGGNVSGVKFTATGGKVGASAYGGTGGETTSGVGGNGGGLLGLTIQNGATSNDTAFLAGYGGSAITNTSGGSGGIVKGVSVTSDGVSNGGILIAGGNGIGTLAEGYSFGGNGGSVSNASIVASGPISLNAEILAGDGGEGRLKAGKGGDIAKASIAMQQSFFSTIAAGKGGSSELGAGADGGNVTGASVTRTGTDVLVIAQINISAGQGGNHTDTANTINLGGDGGSITNSTVTLPVTSGGHIVVVDAGDGGIAGGNGGSIKGFGATIGDDDNRLELGAGRGGDGGNGGRGGNLLNIKVTGSPDNGLHLGAGSGGDATNPDGKGGNSGTVTGLTFDTILTNISINAGVFTGVKGGNGGAGSTAKGGNGGGVTKILGGDSMIVAGAEGGSAGGKGGNGGSVSNIGSFKTGLRLSMVHGGDGGDGAIAGKGGNISNLKGLTVEIGNFSKNFGFFLSSNIRMGGLSVGQGGSVNGNVDESKNGSISSIKAAVSTPITIASIVAGLPANDNVTLENAVTRISNVKAFVGHDIVTDGPGEITVSNNVGTPGFHLGEGDTLVDGIVIVKQGGYVPAQLQGAFPIFEV